MNHYFCLFLTFIFRLRSSNLNLVQNKIDCRVNIRFDIEYVISLKFGEIQVDESRSYMKRSKSISSYQIYTLRFYETNFLAYLRVF